MKYLKEALQSVLFVVFCILVAKYLGAIGIISCIVVGCIYLINTIDN